MSQPIKLKRVDHLTQQPLSSDLALSPKWKASPMSFKMGSLLSAAKAGAFQHQATPRSPLSESHVYVLDPPQEGGKSGSGSTASSQSSSPTMETATLSPSILPYYADLRSLNGPTGLMSPTSPGIEPPNAAARRALSLLQCSPTPSSSTPAARKEKLAIVTAADALLVDESTVVSGPGIVHPGPPPPTQAPTSFSKPLKCPTAHRNKSYKPANGLRYHLTHGQYCFLPS